MLIRNPWSSMDPQIHNSFYWIWSPSPPLEFIMQMYKDNKKSDYLQLRPSDPRDQVVRVHHLFPEIQSNTKIIVTV